MSTGSLFCVCIVLYYNVHYILPRSLLGLFVDCNILAQYRFLGINGIIIMSLYIFFGINGMNFIPSLSAWDIIIPFLAMTLTGLTVDIAYAI